MRKQVFRGSIRALLIIFMCQAVISCSINTRVSYNDEEGRVPEDVIRKIKRKKTEKSWVLAHLGEPFAIDRVVTDEENPQVLVDVYTFRFRKQTAQSGHAFFVFRAGGMEESTEYFHIAFENERVKKSWTDSFPRPQIGTRIRHAKVNTVHVKPSVSKVSVQPQNSATNWKIPILKKWLSPKKIESSEGDSTNGQTQQKAASETATSSMGNATIVAPVPEVPEEPNEFEQEESL